MTRRTFQYRKVLLISLLDNSSRFFLRKCSCSIKEFLLTREACLHRATLGKPHHRRGTSLNKFRASTSLTYIPTRATMSRYRPLTPTRPTSTRARRRAVTTWRGDSWTMSSFQGTPASTSSDTTSYTRDKNSK